MKVEEIRKILDEVESDEASDEAQKKRDLAEIATLTRWLSRRVKGAWRSWATKIVDEPGHWDSQYPPIAYATAWTKKTYLRVRADDWEEDPNESGAYYRFKVVPTRDGLAVSREGEIVRFHRHGTGRFGYFAAHPGRCDRDVTIVYSVDENPSAETIASVVEYLRAVYSAYRHGTDALENPDINVALAAIAGGMATKTQLAEWAKKHNPEELRKAAERLTQAVALSGA